MATCCIQVPMSETPWPRRKRRKLREARARRGAGSAMRYYTRRYRREAASGRRTAIGWCFVFVLSVGKVNGFGKIPRAFRPAACGRMGDGIMAWARRLALALLLLSGLSAGMRAQEAPPADTKEPDTTADDEKAVKEVGVTPDGPALLDYFRKRILPPADPKKIDALVQQL